MANSYDLTSLAEYCLNEIRLVGTLTEFAADAYVKNGVGVIKYKGVVNCDNAFINIRATTTSFDDTFSIFVNEFNTHVVGCKVFLIGKLNGYGGIDVNYIAISRQDDYFEGFVKGLPYKDTDILVVNQGYHDIVNFDENKEIWKDYLCEYKLALNPLKVTDENILDCDIAPTIRCKEFQVLGKIDNAAELIDQALGEHEIYLEAMKQIKEGK